MKTSKVVKQDELLYLSSHSLHDLNFVQPYIAQSVRESLYEFIRHVLFPNIYLFVPLSGILILTLFVSVSKVFVDKLAAK